MAHLHSRSVDSDHEIDTSGRNDPLGGDFSLPPLSMSSTSLKEIDKLLLLLTLMAPMTMMMQAWHRVRPQSKTLTRFLIATRSEISIKSTVEPLLILKICGSYKFGCTRFLRMILRMIFFVSRLDIGGITTHLPAP